MLVRLNERVASGALPDKSQSSPYTAASLIARLESSALSSPSYPLSKTNAQQQSVAARTTRDHIYLSGEVKCSAVL